MRAQPRLVKPKHGSRTHKSMRNMFLTLRNATVFPLARTTRGQLLSKWTLLPASSIFPALNNRHMAPTTCQVLLRTVTSASLTLKAFLP